MQQSGWKNGLLKVSEWLVRLAWINLLWIGFTILGLGIAGFLPSTSAMFAVVRKWLKGNLEKSAAREFWDYFKKDFGQANAAGFLLLVIGYILYIDLFVFDFGNSTSQSLLQLVLYGIAFFYLLTVVFFFPVYVHLKLKWFQYMIYSILVAFSSPFRAIAMLVLGYAVIYLISLFPGAAFFFLGSSIAYLWLLVSLPTFEKWEAKESGSAPHR